MDDVDDGDGGRMGGGRGIAFDRDGVPDGVVCPDINIGT